jgi:hypothetical protein
MEGTPMKPIVILLLLGLAAPTAVAQDMDHSKHMAMMQGMPSEGGQSAFAAIQEIVGLLEADPDTDWSKVNIEALRQHLIDMDNVTHRAHVTASEADGAVIFDVSGDGEVQASIQRMVLAHAATMNGVDGWSYAAEKTATGARLTVTPADPSELVKLKGLGFIGIMAQGMHHQMHHLMLARGMAPHN